MERRENTMEKNQFLIYNDLIDHLYNCTGMEELKKDFMVPVRMLIPYTYCSILLAAEGIDSSSLAQAESLYQPEPVCVPTHLWKRRNGTFRGRHRIRCCG